MTRAALFALSVALAFPLAAQSNNALVAYPNDATSAAWGNCYVVGANAGACNDSRAQILVPARFLPSTGGTITAIEFNTFNSSTLTYSLLDISLESTSRISLDTIFGVNQPNPQLVFTTTNLSITWPANAWVRLLFQAPFNHAGGQGLVIDIRKVIASQTFNTFHYTTLQEREDLPRSIMASSSTASVAGFSTPTWRCRLVFSDRPTVTLGGELAGVVGARHYQLGSQATMRAFGSPGQPVSLLLDISNRIQPTPLSIPGISGTGFIDLATLVILPQINLSVNGDYSLTLNIPTNPALAFRRLGLQALAFDATNGLSFTNYADGFLVP